MRKLGDNNNTDEDDDDDDDEWRDNVISRYALMLRTAAVHAVHKSVKSAKHMLVFQSESFRILLNTAKVPVKILQNTFSD